MSREEQREICEKSSISEYQLKSSLGRIEKTGTLYRLPGSGRKRWKFDLVDRSLREVVQEYGFELSQLTLTELIRKRGISVSTSTVNRVLNSGLWLIKKPKLIPTNTPKHRENRLLFCDQYIAETFGGDGDPTLWIDIDEKAFVEMSRRVMYVPKELEHTIEYIHIHNKTTVEKVMFFGAVAKPRPQRGFDGRILLMPVCEKRSRKRNTKYGKKGEIYNEKITMNVTVFRRYCISHLIPAIRKHLESLPEVTRVVIQMDQAGGHGGGRANIAKTLSVLNGFGKRAKPHITFIAQPSKSPDFNVLDLAVWRSLSCGVVAEKAQKKGRVIDRIIDCVLTRWNNWDAWTRLRNAFDCKKTVLQIVREKGGSNEYDLGHSSRSHATDGPSYMPIQKLDDSDLVSTDDVTEEDSDGDEDDE